MTEVGGELAEVTETHLRWRLAEETDLTVIKRSVAALKYKKGSRQPKPRPDFIIAEVYHDK